LDLFILLTASQNKCAPGGARDVWFCAPRRAAPRRAAPRQRLNFVVARRPSPPGCLQLREFLIARDDGSPEGRVERRDQSVEPRDRAGSNRKLRGLQARSALPISRLMAP